MKDFERALGLLKSDGINAVFHALAMKLKEREKEQTKYDKWIQRFEYQMPIEKAEKDSAFSITLIPVTEEILESIEKAKLRIKANVNFDLLMELLLLTIKEN